MLFDGFRRLDSCWIQRDGKLHVFHKARVPAKRKEAMEKGLTAKLEACWRC